MMMISLILKNNNIIKYNIICGILEMYVLFTKIKIKLKKKTVDDLIKIIFFFYN